MLLLQATVNRQPIYQPSTVNRSINRQPSTVLSYGESLSAFLRRNQRGIDESTKSVPLQAVPCLNGFIVVGDAVTYRDQTYIVESLHYSFQFEESMAVLFWCLSNVSGSGFGYANVTVWTNLLALVDPSVDSGKYKMLPRPHDDDVAAQIFWVYSNLRYVICNAPPLKNKMVHGTTDATLVGDQNDTFRFALGLPPTSSSTTRVVYAPVPQGREFPNSQWDSILGSQWDKIRTNMVCWKMAISVINGRCSAVKQLKVSLFLSQQSTYKNRADYRTYCYTFVRLAENVVNRFFRHEDNDDHQHSINLAETRRIMLQDDPAEEGQLF